VGVDDGASEEGDVDVESLGDEDSASEGAAGVELSPEESDEVVEGTVSLGAASTAVELDSSTEAAVSVGDADGTMGWRLRMVSSPGLLREAVNEE